MSENPQDKDEIINVTLPKQDYVIMREIIERQKSLNWIGKYLRNVLFVAAGGLLTLVAFGDQIKRFLTAFLGT